MKAWMWMVLASVGCAPELSPEDLLDTGWFEDDGVDYTQCPDRVETTLPADGAEGWYWREPLTLYATADAPVYGARLTEASGVVVPTSLTSDDTGLVLSVVPERGLAPDTEHRLEVTDCQGVREVSFTTSSLGTPLRDGPDTVFRRTYQLDLVNADWVEPGGFGATLAGLLQSPILLGVQYVDDEVVDWIGAPGIAILGTMRQDTGRSTWDFPVADFSDRPFFDARADSVSLDVSGYPLVVTDFELQGTFAEDGTTFEEAVIAGLADSRDAGGAVGAENSPRAICNFAEGLGVDCVPCPDGLPTCFRIEIRGVGADPVPDVALVPVR